MSRLSSISDSTGNLAEYTYLGQGTIAKETRPQLSGGLNLNYDPDGDGSFSGFDRFGRVVAQLWKNTAGTVVDGYRYGYDRAGNAAWKQNITPGASGLDELYAYDAIHRLTGAERGTLDFTDPDDPQISGTPTKTQDWTLDGLGNFAAFDDDGDSQTREANAANEITTMTGGTVTPSYDAAGNMISGPKTGDEATRTHYVYDAWNRLVAVYADDMQDPGQPGDVIANYAYDGVNRRVTKTLADGTSTEFYYNHQWQLLEERSLDVQQAVVAVDQYVWDQSYIDAPLVRYHDGNADGDCNLSVQDDPDDTIRYYTWDANHNVTSTRTVDAAATTTVEHYVYDAYGKATVYDDTWQNGAAPSEDGPLYCGYFFDAETANYLARNRYYSVALSNWISRDPIGYNGGLNLYAYLADSPLAGADPSGTGFFKDYGRFFYKDYIRWWLNPLENWWNKPNPSPLTPSEKPLKPGQKLCKDPLTNMNVVCKLIDPKGGGGVSDAYWPDSILPWNDKNVAIGMIECTTCNSGSQAKCHNCCDKLADEVWPRPPAGSLCDKLSRKAAVEGCYTKCDGGALGGGNK